MLTADFTNFYKNWLHKAEQYDGSTIQSAIDRFFSLFVLYNRLYAETTFTLARRGQVDLSHQANFPDGRAAKIYVLQYLDSKKLIELLETDPGCARALDEVIQLLEGTNPSGRRFSIRLSMLRGDPQPALDLELLHKFRSANYNERGAAVLEFLYAIRCNLFHGHKGFDPVQLEVLNPANTILRFIVDKLYHRLDQDYDP